ncbi:MAG TPA: von Willebrand factor type A domain-containing protein, partial [Thermoanaerobaculia bacterium]|nr:von Willebrand factor type A domain-containing protein [Thermoanaerobaculia bacterium]
MNRLNRNDRRRLEQELRDVPTPPPPADLLDRIREEIPDHLPAANEPEPDAGGTWFRRPVFRLAATIAIAALGVTLAWRTLDRRAAEQAAQETLASAPAEAPADATVAEPKISTEAGPAVDEKLPVKKEQRDDRSVVPQAAAEADRPSSPSLEDNVVGGARGRVEAEAEPGAMAARNAAELEQVHRQRAELMEQMKRSLPRRTDEVGAAAPPPASAPPAEPVAGRDSTAKSQPRANEEVPSAEARRKAEVGGRVLQDRDAERQLAESGEALRALPGPVPAPAAPPSTGGTAEPNDQAYGDMFFRPSGTNPFVDTAEDALSTFALDVDTGSYTLARSYLERGTLPPPEAIRVEEFVNAQRYEDPAPRRGEFTLTAEGAPSPFAPSERYRLVRFAVKARELFPDQRKSAVLTFVVDVSGSMDRENRLGLVKRALDLLLDELRPDDRVGLVVYGSRGRVLLGHTRDHEAIRDAIARLRPEGSTNAEEGLRLGYDLADQGFRSGLVNRVILCSDGVANVGATGPESILERIGEEARRGIELTTVGFGMGNYNDALMEQLADQGDGAYHYVDTLDEARKVFVENLTGTLQTVAKDAKVQVEFEPGTVDRWRLLGYENRDVADRDFRNDAIDAGEVGVGHAATALYEIRLAPGARGGERLATLRLRWTSVETGRVVEAHQELRVRDLGASFDRASRDLRLAAVAAELA